MGVRMLFKYMINALPNGGPPPSRIASHLVRLGIEPTNAADGAPGGTPEKARSQARDPALVPPVPVVAARA